MSDEEKKALERIDYIQDFIIENGQYNADVNDMEYFSRIKNLIEKQQKEIEELKVKNKFLNWYFENQKEDFIHKDKIKAKMEEYEKMKEATKMDTTYYGEKRRSVIEGLIAELQSFLEKE